MTATSWLDIDIKGFAQVLENKGKPRILLEPISNALDGETTEVRVDFFHLPEGKGQLVVTDDDPEGFADLRDAYTLYAPSKRRNDPTKRGRFGQGDKELIAICAAGGTVEVRSTTGTVVFDEQGRRNTKEKTASGTTLTAVFKCKRAEAKEFVDLVNKLIVPEEVTLTFNGVEVKRPTPVSVIEGVTLPTKIADEHGNLSDTRRQTTLELFDHDGTAWIYELGVPVVEHDGRYSINVLQKVPLNAARDNVTPSYLRRLREIMLNAIHDRLDAEDMKSAWVRDALPQATDEALRDHVHKVHGDNAVIFDPSNPEASKRAVDEGRAVVYGRQFSTDTWDRIRQAEILQPAGRVIETGIPTSADGEPPIPDEEWTEPMRQLAEYTQEIGRYLLGFFPDVEYSMVRGKFAGGWGGHTITFYLHQLGKNWPATADPVVVDDLLIHEFAHHGAPDHLSDRFYRNCTRLGARLRNCPTTLEAYRG